MSGLAQVIQCLEDPSDPSSLFLVNSEVGRDEVLTQMTSEVACLCVQRRLEAVVAESAVNDAANMLKEPQEDNTNSKQLAVKKSTDKMGGLNDPPKKKPKVTKTSKEGQSSTAVFHRKKEKKGSSISTKKIDS